MEDPITRRQVNAALVAAGAMAAMPAIAFGLGRAMRLGDGQFVAFAQTVGYPARGDL